MSSRAHKLSLLVAFVPALVGLFALGAWLLGSWRLLAIGSEYVPMAPITALLFVLLSTAQGSLLAWPRHHLVRLWVGGACGLTGIVAMLVLVQGGTGPTLPWERWFNPGPVNLDLFPLGRMALLTALCFLVSATALCLQAFARGAWRWGALLASAAVLVTAILVAAGYGAGTPIDYRGDTVPMALLTALAFIALSSSGLLTGALMELVRDWLNADRAASTAAPSDRLGNRLVVALATGLAVLISIYGFFHVRREQAAAREVVQRELLSVAHLKATQIGQWRQERLGEGWFLQRTVAVVEDIAAFLVQPDTPGHRERVLNWLEPIKGGDRYERILLYDPSGELRLALPAAGGEGRAGGKHNVALALLAGGRLTQPTLTDLHADQDGTGVHLSLVVPLFRPAGAAGAGEMLAILVLVLDPAQALYPLLRQWPVPSETAEVFLVRQEGEEVVYLSELRHLEAPPLTVRRSVHERRLAAAMAVRGVKGTHESHDYRGVAVLTVANRIPASAWWLIAKIDQAEIYAPIRKEARRSGLVVVFLVLTVGLAAAFVWRQRQAGYLRHSLAMEQERAALSERLAAVMRYANDIILLLDDDGRIVEANERALAAYGYTLEELRALPAGGLRAPAAAGDLARQLDALQRVEGAHFETVHRRRDGTEFPVEVSGRAVEIAGRRYGLGIYRDISERRAAEAALRASEERLRAYVEQAADALFVHDGAGRILDVNRQACASLGYSREELLRMTVFEVDRGGDPAAIRAAWAESTPGVVKTMQGRHQRRDGSSFPVEVRVGSFELQQERRFLALARDISERVAFEAQIARFNHLYAALSQVNQAIVHATDRAALLREVCRVLVEFGHFRMAWIGRCDPETLQVQVEASHGDDAGYLQGIRIFADDRPEGRGITGTALRENRTVVCNDIAGEAAMGPWREAAARSGLMSSIALPVRLGASVRGALNVYAAERGFFGPEEIALLEEAAMDVTYGFENLAKDDQRRQAELALRSSEERFRTIFKHAPVGISLTMADDGSTLVNDEHCRITGVSEADSHIPGIFHRVTHPEDEVRQAAIVERFVRGEVGHYTIEKRYLHPDGRIQWAELTSRFYTDPATNRRVILTIIIDIGARKEAEARLQQQLEELRRWHQATLGREQRILDLKREVNVLLARAGQPPRYGSAAPGAGAPTNHG